MTGFDGGAPFSAQTVWLPTLGLLPILNMVPLLPELQTTNACDGVRPAETSTDT